MLDGVTTGTDDGMFFLDGLDKGALEARAREARTTVSDETAILNACLNRLGGDIAS